MFYSVAKMVGRTLRDTTKRFVSSTHEDYVVVYDTQPKPEKKVEQLTEQQQDERDAQIRKFTDSINTDYLD